MREAARTSKKRERERYGKEKQRKDDKSGMDGNETKRRTHMRMNGSKTRGKIAIAACTELICAT